MISSHSNPKIKSIVKLQKNSERRAKGLVLIEGKREIEKALLAHWKPETIFFCEELAAHDSADLIKNLPNDCVIEPVTKAVFNHLAYREGSDGLLAVCREKSISLNDIRLSENPLIIVLQSVEKPGNLGAVLRTADAAKVDAVIVCEPLADFYNPNTIRSSLGCVFTQQLVAADTEEAIQWLKNKKINIFCTALTASTDYLNVDYRQAAAIVMGTEATGLSREWLDASDQNILIEMLGIADSLNVSVSTAVVVFEALRQRKQSLTPKL